MIELELEESGSLVDGSVDDAVGGGIEVFRNELSDEFGGRLRLFSGLDDGGTSSGDSSNERTLPIALVTQAGRE